MKQYTHLLALLTTSQTRTARHKKAALTAVVSPFSKVDMIYLFFNQLDRENSGQKKKGEKKKKALEPFFSFHSSQGHWSCYAWCAR